MCTVCEALPRNHAWPFLCLKIKPSVSGFGLVVAMQCTFTFVGKVRGQGRPRFGKHGAYESPEDTAYKKAVADEYNTQEGLWFGNAALSVTIAVIRHLPADRPKRVKSEPDTFKPDIDNIAKAVLDALNGVAYEDDKQVVTLSVSEYPRIRTANDSDFMRVTISTVSQGTVYPYVFEV